jgi:hypothetical protein
MDHFVGIDLHSNNSYIAVIDTDNGCGKELAELSLWAIF